jgi:hypothetical protein
MHTAPFRVLNAFAQVIDEQQPGPPQMKTALPSLPTAPSLSPIKRKTKGDNQAGASPGTPSQDGKNTPKISQKGRVEHRLSILGYTTWRIFTLLYSLRRCHQHWWQPSWQETKKMLSSLVLLYALGELLFAKKALTFYSGIPSQFQSHEGALNVVIYWYWLEFKQVFFFSM